MFEGKDITITLLFYKPKQAYTQSGSFLPDRFHCRNSEVELRLEFELTVVITSEIVDSIPFEAVKLHHEAIKN